MTIINIIIPQTFEVLFGMPLFNIEPHKSFNLEPWEHVLFQMMVFLHERFDPGRLEKSDEYYEFFDDQGECRNSFTGKIDVLMVSSIGVLLKRPDFMDYSLETCVQNFSFFPKQDFDQTVRFMRRSLTLHPDARATADELLKDPWFDGIE